MQDHRAFLVSLFDAAVEAANPDHCLSTFLPEVPRGRTIVVGAGKGSAQLARALEKLWPGTLEGAVVTRYGYGTKCNRIDVLEASHPVPDEAGLLASERMLGLVSNLTADDLVIALVCGGGSALLPAPPEGFELADEIALNEALLKSGAPISVMNAIRKQFSRIKGGRLAAAAHPAKVVSLVVSDIPGDEAALVSSGPTIPNFSTPQDALAMIERYGIELPPRIVDHIRATKPAPLPNDRAFGGHTVSVVASAKVSLEAAAAASEKIGIPAMILSDSLEGEAREAGAFHAALAREIENNARPFATPVALLSGGETTVTVKGTGKGGRNTEFLLSLALGISSTDRVYALAADTDGIDGSEDNAGAFADSGTIDRMLDLGIRAESHLMNNDAWTAFDAVGDLFVCGPTGTNVNDFRAILVS